MIGVCIGLVFGFIVGYILGRRKPPTPPTGIVGTQGGLA